MIYPVDSAIHRLNDWGQKYKRKLKRNNSRRRSDNKENFDFINEVDNVNWPPYRDSKSTEILKARF